MIRSYNRKHKRRRMFCLATIDVFSCVSPPRGSTRDVHTHTHTSGGESIRATSLAKVSLKGVRKERSPTLDIPGDRSGCKFYALAAFSFSTVRAYRHMAALSKAVHYRPPNEPLELVHLPSTRTH